MSQVPENLLEAALQLNAEAREEFAVRLFESLEPLDEENVEAAWSEEIKRRVEELRTGQEVGIPWDQARRMIMDENDGPVRD